MNVGSAHFVGYDDILFQVRTQGVYVVKLSRDMWIEYIPYIVDNHSNSFESVIQMIPEEATNKSNHVLVQLNTLDNLIYEGKYPKLTVSGNVSVLRKTHLRQHIICLNQFSNMYNV